MVFNETVPLMLSRARRKRRAGTDVPGYRPFQNHQRHLGHAAGDEVLREFARRLQASVRTTDLVAARLAGDEFVVVAENIATRDVASALAQKMVARSKPDVQLARTGAERHHQHRHRVSRRRVRADHTDRARWPGADVALYAAKAAGRNRFNLRPGGACAPRSAAYSRSATQPGTAGKCGRQSGGIRTTRHRHVGLAAALAADLLATKFTSSPALTRPRNLRVTPAAICTLSPSTAASTMAAVLSLSLSLSMVSRRRLGVGAGQHGGQHLEALDLHRLAQQFVALVGRQLALEGGHFFLQRTRMLQRLTDAGGEFGDRRLEHASGLVHRVFQALQVGQRIEQPVTASMRRTPRPHRPRPPP